MTTSWYKDTYKTDNKSEAELRLAMQDPEVRADVEGRYEEIKNIHEDRCVVTKEQKRFLARVLDLS